MKLALLILLVFAATFHKVRGLHYYVDSTTGRDTSICGRTPTEPCRTVTRTLRLLQPNDTLIIRPGIYQREDCKLSIGTSSIRIQGDSTDGGVHFACDDSPERIVTILPATSSVVIAGIHFSNSRGGAVRISAHSHSNTIENCTFVNNTASHGAAVYIDPNSNFNSFLDCSFQHNTAHEYGGSVFASSSTGTLFNNTTFVKNRATRGGAVYAENSPMSLSGCSFYNNTASSGAALYIIDTPNQLLSTHDGTDHQCITLSSTQFLSNTALALGGAIYTTRSIIQCSDCNISANSAITGAGIFGSDKSSITITGGKFESNKATEKGGAIYITRDTQLSVTSVAAQLNEAKHGSFVYLNDDSKLTVSGSQMTQNRAYDSEHGGSAVVCLSSVLRLLTVYADSNYNRNLTTTIRSSTTIAQQQQASFVFSQFGVIEIVDTTITNHATPVIIAEYSSLRFASVVVSNNWAADTGRTGSVVHANRCYSVLIQATNFTNNTSGSNGGTLSVSDTASVRISDQSSFINNTAAQHGGAIYLQQCALVDISGPGTVFRDNVAGAGSGGAIYHRGNGNGTVSINGVQFEHNSAGNNGHGGAIHTYCSLSSTTTMRTTNDSQNAAPQHQVPLLAIASSAFDNNTALNGKGGAIFISDACGGADGSRQITITNSDFVENRALSGGAIFHSDATDRADTIDLALLSASRLMVRHSRFIRNEATVGGGGAIFWENTSPPLVEDYLAYGNSATQSYGDFLASLPNHLVLSENLKRPPKSGSLVNKQDSLVVTVVDFYNNPITRPKSDGQLAAPPMPTLASVYSMLSPLGTEDVAICSQNPRVSNNEDGDANFYNFRLIAPPGNYSFVALSHQVERSSVFKVEVDMCSPGWGLYGNKCKECPSGTYQPHSTNEPCIPCPYGHFAFDSGSVTCSPCPPGSFSNRTGAVLCELCPQDHYTPSYGYSFCIRCEGDTSTNDVGQSRCECPPGYFKETDASNLQYVGQCKSCLENVAVNCLGGDNTLVKSGYWRNNQTDIDHVIGCRTAGCIGSRRQKSLADNTNKVIVTGGGPSYMMNLVHDNTETEISAGSSVEVLCEEGYYGPLCDLCSDGYFKVEPTCRKCFGNAVTIAYLVLACCVSFLVAIVFIVQQARTNGASLAQWRPFVWYLQILALFVGTSLYVPWPSPLLEFMHALRFMTFDLINIPVLTCLFPSSLPPEQTVFLKLLVAQLLPIAIPILIFVIWTIINLVRAKAIRQFNGSALEGFKEVLAGMVLIAMLMYPVIAPMYLRMFSCTKVNDISYLSFDFRMQCYSPMWTKLMGVTIPGILIWIVGVPVAYTAIALRHVYVLRRRKEANHKHHNHNNGNSNSNSNKEATTTVLCSKATPNELRVGLRIAFSPYKREYFFWEIVDTIFNLLYCVVLYLPSGSAVQSALSVLISFAVLLIYDRYFPYNSLLANRLRLGLNTLQFLLLLFGLMLNTEWSSATKAVWAGTLFVVLHTVAIAGCLLFVIIRAIRKYRRGRKLLRGKGGRGGKLVPVSTTETSNSDELDNGFYDDNDDEEEEEEEMEEQQQQQQQESPTRERNKQFFERLDSFSSSPIGSPAPVPSSLLPFAHAEPNNNNNNTSGNNGLDMDHITFDLNNNDHAEAETIELPLPPIPALPPPPPPQAPAMLLPPLPPPPADITGDGDDNNDDEEEEEEGVPFEFLSLRDYTMEQFSALGITPPPHILARMAAASAGQPTALQSTAAATTAGPSPPSSVASDSDCSDSESSSMIKSSAAITTTTTTTGGGGRGGNNNTSRRTTSTTTGGFKSAALATTRNRSPSQQSLLSSGGEHNNKNNSKTRRPNSAVNLAKAAALRNAAAASASRNKNKNNNDSNSGKPQQQQQPRRRS